MYIVEIAYGKHSGYIGGATTLDAARAEQTKMEAFYANYGIRESRIFRQCEVCQGYGRCRICRHKTHAFFMERCYKVCKVCKGTGELPLED